MIQRLCLFLTIVLTLAKSFAQNQQILYDFDQLPQTLLLNPGAEVNYDKHFGIPLLSSFYFQIGATNKNINYNNVISGSNGSLDVLSNIFEQDLNSNEIFLINQQLEIISGGLRLKNGNSYLSFGMYQEIEGFANYPKDLADLFFNGNDQNRDGSPEKGDIFKLNQLNFIGELVGVFHVGISKQINSKLNVGARLKFLSGSLQLNSKNNNGAYQLSSNLINQHNFDAMNVVINTSGFIQLNDVDGSLGSSAFGGLSDAVSGLFFMGGNFGAGIDLGFTYHFNESITLTGSLIDLDFITYSNKVVNYSLTEDFILSENNNRDYFDPPEGGELNYWEDKLTPYYESDQIPLETLVNSYTFGRSPKLNASVKYQFNNKSNENYNSVFRDARYVTPVNEGLISEVGIQTYTDFKPNYLLWAVTAFYTREITKGFKAKITYTYDKFSAKNIGLGISTHIRSFNFYATADNLLALPKLKDSNYQSFQIGMNFIFY